MTTFRRRVAITCSIVMLAAASGCASRDGVTEAASQAPLVAAEGDPPETLADPLTPDAEGRNDWSSETPSAEVEDVVSVSTAPPTGTPLPQGAVGGTVAEGPLTDLVLAEQITSLPAGDGAGTDCTADLENLPARFAEQPSVWLSSFRDLDPLPLPWEIALCIKGFPAGAPVIVTLDAGGGTTYVTTAELAPEPFAFDRDIAPETLFVGGGSIRLEQLGPDVFMSQMWEFVPPDGPREELAGSGGLRIRAEQGEIVAEHEQSVVMPERPGRIFLDEPGSEHQPRLLVMGFERRMRIPVGLYRYLEGEFPGDGKAQLVRRIGIVTMPASRLAVFPIPRDVLREGAGGEHCITVPLDAQEEYNCPSWGDGEVPSPPPLQ